MKEQPSSLHQLAQQFHDLKRDLDAIGTARSSTGTAVSRRRYVAQPTTPDILALFESSPRKLVSSLQLADSPSGASDMAEGDITTERRVVFGSGRLKGRSLLEALDCAAATEEEVCSTCSSSAFLQGNEEEAVTVEDGGGCEEKRLAVRCVVSTAVIVMAVVIGLFWLLVLCEGDDRGVRDAHLVPT